jgi:hypothetical protein
MSSSGISTTTACGLSATASAGNIDGAATATAVVATIAIAACYGSAAIGGCRGSATVAASCASTAAADYRGSVVIATCCGPRPQLCHASPRSPPSSCSRPPSTPSMSAAWWGRPRPTSAPWQVREGAQWAPPYECEDEKVKP